MGQMSQIFDSLIITNDRPYVSCGLESPASCPGLLDFSQFELINKVGWDSEDLMFTILEPGVYMLQMGGNLCGASVVAKMVNEDVEAEVVTLEGGAQLSFRSRSGCRATSGGGGGAGRGRRQSGERLLPPPVQ